MADLPARSLIAILGERAPSFRILDVGALFKAEAPIAYAPLLAYKHTTVVGFEPVQSECDRLNRMFGATQKFFPYAVGDGRKASFYRCNHTMTSSLLEPDLDAMGLFQNLPEFCQVVETSEIQTRRLDDIPDAHGADYLKIDVQGSQAQVLSGAHNSLQSVLVIQTEVEFVAIYKSEPLFGEIDAMLRSRGFMFHRLMNPEGRTLRGNAFPDLETTRSQLLWADAVYIRPVTSWRELSSNQLLRLAVILHELYRSLDFCACALDIFDEREGTDIRRQYSQAFRV